MASLGGNAESVHHRFEREHQEETHRRHDLCEVLRGDHQREFRVFVVDLLLRCRSTDHLADFVFHGEKTASVADSREEHLNDDGQVEVLLSHSKPEQQPAGEVTKRARSLLRTHTRNHTARPAPNLSGLEREHEGRQTVRPSAWAEGQLDAWNQRGKHRGLKHPRAGAEARASMSCTRTRGG